MIPDLAERGSETVVIVHRRAIEWLVVVLGPLDPPTDQKPGNVMLRAGGMWASLGADLPEGTVGGDFPRRPA